MMTAVLVFDPFSEEFYRNPHHVFARMREESPVYYDAEHDFYALSRHADVAGAYRDFVNFSSTAGIDLAMMRAEEAPPSVLPFMDPPEHGRMRGLVSKAFTPRAVSSLRPAVEGIVREYLSRADRRKFDVVNDFSSPFPVEVITRLIGVPESLRPQVRTWTEQAMRFRLGRAADEAAQASLVELFDLYFTLVNERRADPADDMLGALVAAEIERDNGDLTRLDDFEIASFAILLGAAGAVTVTKLVASAIALFAQHPEQWQRLLDDRELVGAAVEEVLRYEGPIFYNLRRTVSDVTMHGVTIPAGKPVLLYTASANRDPAAFAGADTFDIARVRTGQHHLSLGYGIHSCLGAALARMQAAVALEHLLEFMPCYDVVWPEAERIEPSNETGWSRLPVVLR